MNLELIDYKIKSLAFSDNGLGCNETENKNPFCNVTFDAIPHLSDYNLSLIGVTFEVNKDHIDDKFPLQCVCEMHGIFSIKPDEGEGDGVDEMFSILWLECMPILYEAFRNELLTLSAKSKSGPYFMPMLNYKDLNRTLPLMDKLRQEFTGIKRHMIEGDCVDNKSKRDQEIT